MSPGALAGAPGLHDGYEERQRNRPVITFRKLNYNCHDGLLVACEAGPQREVTLEIHLNPVWHPAAPPIVRVHFGAISNFEEVRDFFEPVQESGKRGALDQVVGIVCREKGQWIVDLARGGAVTIATPKMPNNQ